MNSFNAFRARIGSFFSTWIAPGKIILKEDKRQPPLTWPETKQALAFQLLLLSFVSCSNIVAVGRQQGDGPMIDYDPHRIPEVAKKRK